MSITNVAERLIQAVQYAGLALVVIVFEMPFVWMLLPVVELSLLVGKVGVAVLAFLKQVTGTNLVPVADPRLDESLAFHNI
jgi:hypothetical protein